MKIAHIGSRGIPARYSGVEKIVEETSKRLVKQGFKVSVYCHSDNFGTSRYEGVRLIRIPTINTKHLAALIHSFLSTLHVIFTDTQVVHYHCLGPSVFSFIPRIFGKKTIVTVHALDWKRAKWNHLVKFVLKLCEIPAIYFPNKTIVVSLYLKNYFKRKYNKEIIYIPNGISVPPHRRASSLQPNSSYILFVGRIVPEKGLHYLIKAFNEIHTDKQLWIAGAPSFTNNYLDQLKKMAGNNVKFLGPAHGEKLIELYRNAYILALPSEVEGSSTVLLEAMTYEKCCLVSDIPENMDNFADCVVSFKNMNYIDLKNKLEWCLSHPLEINIIGKKALEKIEKFYSWDIIIPLILKSYITTYTSEVYCLLHNAERMPANIQNK